MPKPSDRFAQFFKAQLCDQITLDRLEAIRSQCRELLSFASNEVPENPEKTAGLRKLLEAKDCFVRAVLYKEPE